MSATLMPEENDRPDSILGTPTSVMNEEPVANGPAIPGEDPEDDDDADDDEFETTHLDEENEDN